MLLKNKYRLFLITFVFLVLISFYLTYQRSFILKDFEIIRDSTEVENASTLVIPPANITELVPTTTVITEETGSSSTSR